MASKKQIKIGNILIGGNAPVAVQSMLNTPAGDIDACVKQAKALEAAGCEIIRTTVPDMEAVRTVAALKEAVQVPIVADIHFDYKMALEAADAGADKIRINPGNIGSDDRVKAVANKCAEKQIPIRIGVNSGSVEKEILAKYGGPTAEAMAESALYHIALLNRHDFDDIAVSLKSSTVKTAVEAYRLMAAKTDYPLHIGITEAGTERMGLLKSAAGIGSLLLDGIGDTIRVSLTADPVREVYAGFDILNAIGVRQKGVNLISCPTCGRTKIDLIGLAGRVEEALRGCDKNITVAVMGCAVNGPGEAAHADIGIAGGNGEGLLFAKGQILRKVPEEALFDELMKEIHRL